MNFRRLNLLALLAAALPVAAQDWQNKPLRIVVPYPLGEGRRGG